jgi:predicted P-loop ATPase
MLVDIPAIAELAEGGARFCCWNWVERDGQRTKPPIDAHNGKMASSTDRATWSTLDEALATRQKRKLAGIGWMLDSSTDGIVGIDLDGCRDAETGELKPWARKIVAALRSYTEVSPSGTGVKILVRCDPVPRCAVHKHVIQAANGSKAQQIEVFAEARYFCLTGEVPEGCVDEIADATPEVEKLFAWMAKKAGGGQAGGHHGELPAAFVALLGKSPSLAAAWASGAKIGHGTDITASALDWSLAQHLRPFLRDSDIAAVLRVYPFGQIGSGKLKGRQAESRIERLLAELPPYRGETVERPAPEAEPVHAPSDQPVHDWKGLLETTEKGKPLNTLLNAAIALRHAPELSGRIRLNQFANKIELHGMPWDEPSGVMRESRDADNSMLAEWCQKQGVPVSVTNCWDALVNVAHSNAYHPLRDHLDGLSWDGTKRIDSWLSDFLGVEANVYTAAVGRKFLISCVARARRPGCKVDTMLILEGGQGVGKSKAAALLGTHPSWFTDEISEMGTKAAGEDLQGKWIIELAELGAMKPATVERVKAFISRSTDRFRAAYGKVSQDWPRQCVFVGTTNADTYLRDETGGRRFWPVKVGYIDHKRLRAAVPQLWAEADDAYRRGETWWLDGTVEALAAEEQAARHEVDAWHDRIEEHLAQRVQWVLVTDILEKVIGVKSENHDQLCQKRVAGVLKTLGWVRRKTWIAETRITKWAYHKPDLPRADGEGEKAGNE